MHGHHHAALGRPSIIFGVALLVILRRVFDIELVLLTVGAGHVLLAVPFAMLVLMSRLEGFEKSLEEASPISASGHG